MGGFIVYERFGIPMQSVEVALEKLQKSTFRSRFHLTERDKSYVLEKGKETIEEHARVFVLARLAPAFPANDGKQTPMRGHPVFVAMHATACCCRGCLQKWYRVPKGKPLTDSAQKKIVALLMAWITNEMEG